MKKNIKNIILCGLIVISIVMICLTFNHAKNNLQSSDKITNSTFDREIKDIGGAKGQLDDEIEDGTIGKGGIGKGQIDEDDVPDEVKEKFPINDNDEITDKEFKADGGFGGAGQDVLQSKIKLTTSYIVFIGAWCLILSLSLTYLLMGNFGNKKVFVNSNKTIIYVLLNIIITGVLTFGLTYLGNNYFLNNEVTNSNVEYSSTDDLHIDMDNWSYDDANNVYYQIGLVYASNPVEVLYESLGIYVPGDYMDCDATSNGKYTCSLNTENKVGNYTSKTAPIVMPMNTAGYSAQAAPVSYSYSGLSDYLNAGFIYVYSGCRGRNNGEDYAGGAPWAVTDFKAAIRYLRYNAESLPGDTDSLFVFGMSGGGAQSTLVGTTGDSDLYTPYLQSIEAIMTDDEGNEISDAVTGIMAWCPITSLDYANEAYEWNMGQYMTTATRSDSTWTSALSDDMAKAYTDYINALKLIDEDGNVLTLDSSENGVYTSGSYYNYLLDVIETSLNNYLSDNYSSTSKMQSYIDSLNTDEQWITFDSSNNTVTISSIEAFVTHCKKTTKDVGAFDDLNRSQGENAVFGNEVDDSLHFDYTMASLLKENASKYSLYSDYDSKYIDEYNNDLDNVDALGNSSQYRQNMYNPMYYLTDYYDGYETSNVAKYWRIRTGITQGDTALTVETNLALALNQYKTVESVDFATVWNQGHTTAERTGDSTTNFINWVNECMTN